MKRLLIWVLMLMVYYPLTFADSMINYVECNPKSGSAVSTFNFSLEFSVTDPPADYGIGWSGYYNAKRPQRTQAVELYEGDRETGVFLARTMTSTVDGLSSDFQIGNKVQISFPDVIPEKGKIYNIYISNQFTVNKKNDINFIGANCVDFYSDGDNSKNLNITYVGASGDSESLSLESTSLRSQQELDVLSAITYTFNNPVLVDADAKIQLKEGDGVVSTSTKWEQTDEKSVTFSFDDVELMLSHTYVLTLPESVVSMASDSNQKNAAFDITLIGSLSRLVELGGVSPDTNEKQILSSVKASFNLPEGYKFYTPEGLANKYVAKLYQSEVAEDNQVASIQGVISSGKNVIWDLPSISLMPATQYILYVPEGQFWVYDTNNKRANEYSNAEVKLVYTTPTIEEAEFSPMELGKPTLRGGSPVVNDGDSFSSIDRLEIAFPNLKYEDNGQKLGFYNDTNNAKGYLYDITTETPVLVKEFMIDTQNRETATEYYNILCFFINSILYEGHEYRIEMPEGAFTVSDPKLYNYVRTPAFSINVKGSTPTEIKLIGTSIDEGAELSSLGDVVFKFNGDLVLKPDASAELFSYRSSGTLAEWTKLPVTVYSINNETSVAVHASIATTGNPRNLRKDYTYTLTLPEGSVYVESLPETANKEVSLNFKGVEAPPLITEPEYVAVKVSYMSPVGGVSAEGYNPSDYTPAYSVNNEKFVKGNSLTLDFDTKVWKVEHLVRFSGDGAMTDLKEFAETGKYTSSAINDNTRFEVVLAYDDGIVFSDTTTGIAELEKLNVRVYSSNDGNIMIDGLQGGEQVTVYSSTGLVIGTHQATAAYDTVAIAAPTGQTYIVRIQRGTQAQAAKIMH